MLNDKKFFVSSRGCTVEDLTELYNEFTKDDVFEEIDKYLSEADKPLFNDIIEEYKSEVKKGLETDLYIYEMFKHMNTPENRFNYYMDTYRNAVYTYSSLYVWLTLLTIDQDLNSNSNKYVKAYKICEEMDINWHKYIDEFDSIDSKTFKGAPQ